MVLRTKVLMLKQKKNVKKYRLFVRLSCFSADAKQKEF